MAWLWSALAWLVGCNGEHLVLTSGDAAPPAYGSEGVPPMQDPTLDDLYEPPMFFGDSCPPSPAERRQLSDCWPSPYVGVWSGFFVGDPKYQARDGSLQSFPSGQLQLRLALDGTGSLSFGTASVRAAPDGADDPYVCAGATPSEGCPAAQRLLEGFAYGLEKLQLFDATRAAPRVAGEEPIPIGERFGFEISLGEPWRSWCEAQPLEAMPCDCSGECETAICYRPRLTSTALDEGACETSPQSAACGWLAARSERPCSCSSEGCSARERTLSLMLQMSEDGESVRGEYLPGRGDLRPGRLELSRVE